MTYPQNFETKISFDKIRSLLKDQCTSILGKEKADEIIFSTDFDEIDEHINQSAEFVRILTEESDFPFGGFFDGRNALRKIRIEGTFLDESEVFDLRRSLDTVHSIILFFKNTENEQYPYLKRLAPLNPPSGGDFEGSTSAKSPPEGGFRGAWVLLKEIDKILDKFGKIKDSASPRLSQIRRDLLSVQSGISKTLASILRQAKTDGYVEKDMSPTMREGRLVIPVNPAHKRRIKGIVHDESATGKTVFIEPAEVVEENNRLRELEAAERREIIKILTIFTDFVRPFVEEILLSYDFFAKIDFIRAKALFAQNINAIKPSVENNCLIDWQKATHPLLLLSHRKLQKDVVPLDIKLDKENRILLISGPNAGGKSVCLKTVGLLQYMLQCGLLVPLHESSRMGIFERIFIDIGDEQSIENDLSTYSSHLTNMKFFLRNSNARSLLLIDEFGAGTEPHIGGAIAESILHQFNENQVFGVINTHYTNLKHFAEDTAGIVNGAMLYDRHLMQPLFELQIGNPGSSFAIEIARKIGLPEAVIAEATEKVGTDYVNFDKHLQDVVRDKRYWESKRQQIRLKEKQLEETLARYKRELESIDNQRKEHIRNAKTEAKNILEQANAKIENTIRQIREAQAEKEQTKQVREDFSKFKKKLLAPPAPPQGGEPYRSQSPPLRGDLGGLVRLKGQNSIGKILEINDKMAVVAFGNLKLNTKISDLEKINNNHTKKENRQTSFVSSATNENLRQRKLNFKQEIDIRGMRVDEALQTVMYFIDDALMVGVAQVRILHGTGTGALRQSLRQYLGTVAGVSSFADEHVQFGGAGITVVRL